MKVTVPSKDWNVSIHNRQISGTGYFAWKSPAYDLDMVDPVPVPVPIPPTSLRLGALDCYLNKKLPAVTSLMANSAGLVAELQANQRIAGTWVETGAFATPIYWVDSTTPLVKVTIQDEPTGRNADLCAAGVPIPVNALPATGSDAHLCIINKSTKIAYDFWQMKPLTNGTWHCTDVGIELDVENSDGILEVRNDGWNCATASGAPLWAGPIMYSELKAKLIPHGLAITLNRPKNYPAFVWPANRTDGWYTGANAIPEGTRFRFPASTVINPAWKDLTKMIVTAVRDYGMTVVDKTGAGVGFSLEDLRQYGVTDGMTELKKYMGGLEIWDVLGDGKEFQWASLVALEAKLY